MREETQGNDIECNIESNFDLDTFNDVEMKKVRLLLNSIGLSVNDKSHIDRQRFGT